MLEPASKLACTRALGQSTLAGELAAAGSDADDLYAALDSLLLSVVSERRGAHLPRGAAGSAGDSVLFRELPHQPGDIREAPVAGELAVGDAG